MRRSEALEYRRKIVEHPAYKNVYDSMFDGLKIVSSMDSPIIINQLPFPVKPNVWYSFDGLLYVGAKDGICMAENRDEMLIAWEDKL